MKLSGKKILVLGAGSSGMAAVKFLTQRGAIVGVYDDAKVIFQSPYAIRIESAKQIEAEQFEFCVISPGISINHEIAQKFAGRIISELALGFCAPHKKVVAITGTNGKTTVTRMIAAALGKRGVACGNIGTPVTAVSDQISKKISVAEVSSFMLEAPYGDFCADIGVILNITQDHLERHGSMQEYIRCKANLCKSRIVVLNYDDENCRRLSGENTFYFSQTSKVRGVYLDGRNVVLNISKRPRIIFDLDEFDEKKPHTVSNILAVVLVCALLKVKLSRVLKACKGFKTDENRIQYIGSIDNVTFYNDSKATNIAACLAACKVFKCPINLLIGGQVKGQDFRELFEKLPSSVEHIFCFGSGSDVIMKTAESTGYKSITKCDNMSNATEQAIKFGYGPRVVLLSPACASLDEYSNYAERGKGFTEIVRRLGCDKFQ